MSSAKSAKTFFAAIKGNAGMLSTVDDTVYDGHLATLDKLIIKDEDRTHWHRSEPLQGIYNGVAVDKNGVVTVPDNYGIISDTRKEMLVNRPTNTRLVEISTGIFELWVTSKNMEIARFDVNGSHIGGFGTYDCSGDVVEAYDNAEDVAVDVGNGKVAIAMGESHQVKVFDLTTNALLFSIGIYDDCGDPVDGLLNNPTSVVWLASGNLLIANYKGKPAGSDKSRGHISEYDGITGAYITTHFMYTNTSSGDAWHGGVTNPVHMHADITNNKLYVVYHMDNYVGVFDLTTYAYLESFGRTRGTEIGFFRPTSCFPDETNGRLYVTLSSPDQLICLDMNNHDLLGSFGTMRWDDPGADHPQLTSNLFELSCVVAWGNTLFLANRGNNKLVSLPDTLLFGNQEVIVDYEGLDLTELRVLAFSKEEIIVNTDGGVTYNTTKEQIYSEGFGSFLEVFIIMVEENR